MARSAIRRAREMRDSWIARLTGMPVVQATRQAVVPGRGADYRDAAQEWVCNRKKAYASEDLARRVAARLNASNADEQTARPGFYGVVVNPYACGRCGFWHLGR